MVLSSAAEDYLKTIYKLRSNDDAVTTQAIAGRLEISAPSATAMIKKLAAMGLVRHTPYRGVELSEAGEKIALEVIRHHRLIETYLAEVLGVPWDKVHDEAERWEHVLSEEVEERIAEALGHPTHDPHGAPIPTLEGTIPKNGWTRLSEAVCGSKVIVRRVSDESAELLRHLREVNLVPGVKVEILRAVAAEGVLQLKIAGRRQTIGRAPANEVFVEACELEQQEVQEQENAA